MLVAISSFFALSSLYAKGIAISMEADSEQYDAVLLFGGVDGHALAMCDCKAWSCLGEVGQCRGGGWMELVSVVGDCSG